MKGKFDYMQLPNHIQFETVSQATKLLEKRRMLYEVGGSQQVHEALEQQKEEFNRQKEGLQRHEEIVREADITIQEHLIKYGQSLIETEKKIYKTNERRRADEIDLQKFETDILREKQIIEELDKHKSVLEMKIRSLHKYEQFLEQISADKELFTDTNDMLVRQKTLVKSNSELEEKVRRNEAMIEELKNAKVKLKKEKDDKKLQLTNEIARLQEEFEVAWAHARKRRTRS